MSMQVTTLWHSTLRTTSVKWWQITTLIIHIYWTSQNTLVGTRHILLFTKQWLCLDRFACLLYQIVRSTSFPSAAMSSSFCSLIIWYKKDLNVKGVFFMNSSVICLNVVTLVCWKLAVQDMFLQLSQAVAEALWILCGWSADMQEQQRFVKTYLEASGEILNLG